MELYKHITYKQITYIGVLHISMSHMKKLRLKEIICSGSYSYQGKKSRNANLGNITSGHMCYKQILITEIELKIVQDLTIVNLSMLNDRFETEK